MLMQCIQFFTSTLIAPAIIDIHMRLVCLSNLSEPFYSTSPFDISVVALVHLCLAAQGAFIHCPLISSRSHP